MGETERKAEQPCLGSILQPLVCTESLPALWSNAADFYFIYSTFDASDHPNVKTILRQV